MSQPVIKLRCPSLTSVFISLLVLLASYMYYMYATSEHRQLLRLQNLDVPVTVVVLLISAFFLFVEPIAQPQSYHNFADKRRCVCRCGGRGMPSMVFLPPNYPNKSGDKSKLSNASGAQAAISVPNFGDTASNVVILLGGICGVVSLFALEIMENAKAGVIGSRSPSEEWQLNVCLPIFFLATVAVSVGSTYYHWNPNDATLVWDRLPITVAFAAIFCYMLDEYLPVEENGDKDVAGRSIGQDMIVPLISTGIGSVLYWSRTDDLRLYAVIAIFPMLLMVALVVFYSPPRHGGMVQQVVGLMLYAAAKICEDKDHEIYNWTGRRISGHSLKHILAGLAPIAIAHMVLVRH